MTTEEELIELRQQNSLLLEQVKQTPALQEIITQLSEQVKQLQERLAKDSHNSSLPPCTNRFPRQGKSRSLHPQKGTLTALIKRTATLLKSIEEQIKTALSQAKVIHQDETRVYVMEKRNWMHVTSTRTLTHYQAHSSRGHDALDEIGILAHFAGTSVHFVAISLARENRACPCLRLWRRRCEANLCSLLSRQHD